MKPWFKWITATLIALIVGAQAVSLYKYFQPKTSSSFKADATLAAGKNDALVFVSALGRLEPRGKVIRLAASPAVEGARLAKLLVSEGDDIKVGQIVAVLDTQQHLQTAVIEAERQVAIAQARLAQVQAGAKRGDIAAQEAALERLEDERLYAQVGLQRFERLYASGVVTATEVESRKLNLNTVVKDIARNQAALAALREVRPTDVRLAQAEIEGLQAVVARARANLELTNVRSLTNGRVLKINTAPGEATSSGDTKCILEIGETDQMYAIAEVFEADVHRVQIGQSVELSVRTMNQTLRGTVESIGLQIGKRNILDPDPVADLDSRVVEVRVRLHKVDSRTVARLTNLRVDVRINTQRIKSAKQEGVAQ